MVSLLSSRAGGRRPSCPTIRYGTRDPWWQTPHHKRKSWKDGLSWRSLSKSVGGIGAWVGPSIKSSRRWPTSCFESERVEAPPRAHHLHTRLSQQASAVSSSGELDHRYAVGHVQGHRQGLQRCACPCFGGRAPQGEIVLSRGARALLRRSAQQGLQDWQVDGRAEDEDARGARTRRRHQARWGAAWQPQPRFRVRRRSRRMAARTTRAHSPAASSSSTRR